jgi:hypothetical protein
MQVLENIAFLNEVRKPIIKTDIKFSVLAG